MTAILVSSLLITSLVLQLFVRLIIGKKNARYKANLRIRSYRDVVKLGQWTLLPLVDLFFIFYTLVLQTIGTREMHKITTRKAVLVTAVQVMAEVSLYLLLFKPLLTGISTVVIVLSHFLSP
jgi:hypothetical protein